MWLREKKMLNNFQVNIFPVWKKEIYDIIWYELEIIVDWESLSFDATGYTTPTEPYSDIYHEFFDKYIFGIIKNTFAKICVDDFSKEAFKNWVQDLRIKYEEWITPYIPFDYKSGSLYVNLSPTTDNSSREQDLQDFIEKNL